MSNFVQIGLCRVLGIAVLAGFIGVGAQAQATPDAEFKKLGDAFSQAWAKGDAKAIAALHTKDAVRMGGDGAPVVVGPAAIEKSLGEAFAGPYKGTTLTITPGTYTRVAPDVYIGEGSYEVVGGTPPAGVSVRGQYMNTMVRVSGRWMIAGSAVMPIAPAK